MSPSASFCTPGGGDDIIIVIVVVVRSFAASALLIACRLCSNHSGPAVGMDSGSRSTIFSEVDDVDDDNGAFNIIGECCEDVATDVAVVERFVGLSVMEAEESVPARKKRKGKKMVKY